MALKLFSGTSNPKLSEDVAKHIGVPLAKAEVIRFNNSEVRVQIQEDVKHDTCVIIQSTSNPTDTNLMELYLMVDALRREEARRVIGVVPYFGYARQDIQHRSGECVSANVVIRFMEAIGFHKIYTFNLHDEATEGVFNIPFKNLSAFPLLADTIHKYFEGKNTSIDPANIAIVSPDQGGIERARKFGNQFFGTEAFQLAVTEKRRDLEHKHQSKALDLYGDVKGKTAIIVDDVVTSGGTLINAAHFCLESGATSVIAAIVHRDFAHDTAKKIQNSKIEAFFTTDTIALKDEYTFEKMKTSSVADMLGEVIKEIPTVKI
jgi:ribose-phosphate pyrophosphokinase